MIENEKENLEGEERIIN